MRRKSRRLLGPTVAGAIGLVAAAIVAMSQSAAATPRSGLGPVTTDFRSSAACPSDGRRQLTSSAPGAGHHLVPDGANQVLLCRYQGLNPRPSDQGRLLAQRLVRDARTVHELTREFDALPRLPRGSFACPVDFGVRIVAIFRYRPSTSSDDPVSVDPNGCAPVTNGHVARTAIFPAGQRLIAQLARLSGMAVMNSR